MLVQPMQRGVKRAGSVQGNRGGYTELCLWVHGMDAITLASLSLSSASWSPGLRARREPEAEKGTAELFEGIG
jgi:hypothetical protein